MKKKGFSGMFTVLGMIGLFYGCSQESLDTYDSSENSIYFGMENKSSAYSKVFLDTTVFSFGDHENITDTTVMIRVNALGGYFYEPREFEFEVVDSLTTAKEGIHFTLPETRKGVIPAEATCGYIPVHITYNADMKNRAMWYLVLQLKPNRYFNLDLKLEYVDKNNDEYVQLTRHCIGISARIQQPESWFRVAEFFGTFSSDKYKLINMVCGLTKEDWEVMQRNIGEVYWIAVRNYLQLRIDAGDPVMEEDERTGRKQIMVVTGLTGIN